jgi:hypothetical protein
MIFSYLRKSFLITIGLLAIFSFPNSILASNISFSISPQKFEWDFFPGENRESKITISNRSETALPISVRTLTFDAAEDTGNMIFVSDGDIEESPGLWFDFLQPDFILEPKEKRELSFKINIPREASPGGYSAFIIFEPRLPSHYFEVGAARAIPAIGAPVLISVKSLYLDLEEKDDLEIVEFSSLKEDRMAFFEGALGSIEKVLTPKAEAMEQRNVQAVRGKPSSFILRIRNNSTYHLRPEGTATIRNVFNRKVGEIYIPGQTILPGRTRAFNVDFSPESHFTYRWLPEGVSSFLNERIFAGRYKVDLNLYSPYISGSLDSVARGGYSMVLYSIPKMLILLLLAFMVLLLFLIKKRERLIPAVKIFIKR